MAASSVSTNLSAIVVPVFQCICRSLIGESLLQRYVERYVWLKCVDVFFITDLATLSGNGNHFPETEVN